ncbi:MAG: hypothetical protein ABR497_09340, partial [Kiritimatiellia bacterium]
MTHIYFKCKCSKLMAVEQRGAGLAVPCPDCGNENTVPAPDITWECDGCGEELSAPLKMIGGSLRCLQCRTKVTVPCPPFRDRLPLLPGLARQKIADWFKRVRHKPDAGASPDDMEPQERAGAPSQPAPGVSVGASASPGQPMPSGAATDPLSASPHKPVKLVVQRPRSGGYNLQSVNSPPTFRRAGRVRRLLARAAILLILAGAGAAAWYYRQPLTVWW